MKFHILFSITILLIVFPSLEAQAALFPYSESFDSAAVPALPSDWTADGFIMNSSAFRSSPYCLSTTGNMTQKTVVSRHFDFSNRLPDELTFWERRSGTAAAYRLEVRASIDGITFDILLARFDTISSTSGYVRRNIDLKGSGLQNQPNVRFQWRLLEDGANTTGVLRIDDVLLTLSTGLDIGLTSMVVLPENATRKDTLIFTVGVKNYGYSTASNFSVIFFIDINCNGLAEPYEQFSEMNGLVLNPGDSLTCSTSYLPMKAGEFCFIAVTGLPQDENRTNDTVYTMAGIRCMKGDLLINEIMYAPSGDEQEWVEIYNASSDSVNLKSWKISDSNTSAKSVLSQSSIIIAPESYLVISKDINYSALHPDVFSVAANFSTLNNTTQDAVVLYDALSYVIDSVMYQPKWGEQNGKSLERIDVQASGIGAANWGTSQDSSGCTPGKANSIKRIDYDLSIGNITQTWIVSTGKRIPVINATVYNIGREIIDSIDLNIYTGQYELIQSVVFAESIFPGDSVFISESLPLAGSGEIRVTVVVNNWKDERLWNNRDTITVRAGFQPRSLIINELMFEPLNGQNEWLELYNRSAEPIDLAYWTFNDKPTLSGVNSFTISDSSLMVQPGGFVVIVADSSVLSVFLYLAKLTQDILLVILSHSSGFSLNNDGDAVVLKDITGQSIDSVVYLSQWHHPDAVDTRGRSLERINPDIDTNDPRNWGTCTNAAGGTPGKINSVMTTITANNSTISISPNPFSPDGDGFEDYCVIHYDFSMPASILNVKIYDIKGRCIRMLANCEFAGTKGEIIWDGYDENKQKARIGVYIVYTEATDRSSGRVESAKAVAVVAAKL